MPDVDENTLHVYCYVIVNNESTWAFREATYHSAVDY